ncbi:MAG: ATP-dependent metallopeptidase FtsH/Yme1/Tma family protein, partial [Clostridia bacterium]
MNEVNTPKKPLIYYYSIALLVILLFNILVMPLIAQNKVEEVDYGTFMTMTEKKEIGNVEIEDNQIVFTDKEGEQIYKTGRMDDPELVDRLYASGVKFTSEIVEEMSPLLSLLLTWILPLVIFVIIGQLLMKRMMKKAGGGNNAMMFGAGKSNAK